MLPERNSFNNKQAKMLLLISPLTPLTGEETMILGANLASSTVSLRRHTTEVVTEINREVQMEPMRRIVWARRGVGVPCITNRNWWSEARGRRRRAVEVATVDDDTSPPSDSGW